ncbi:hypothetical protein Tco_0819662 [Tanacetum coccineum]|uniref:Uncharacterized protein n=1 Tax=Tanacetum coccineum TaxID=301880 RepID=A0ABQ5A889_9ASTR
MVNESLIAELERYKERVTIFEQRQNVDLNKHEQLIDSQMNDLIRNRNAKFAAFQQEIETLKETLNNNVKEKESLSTTLNVFKTESKEKEPKDIHKEIVLEKQNKELENIISLGYQNLFHLKKAQRIKPTLYDGSVIAKEHDVIFVIDDEETLILEEESRSKMLDKQNDPISIKQKINSSLIDYSKIEAPSELPKISLVNESLTKLKYQLASFDKVVKKRTTYDVITAASLNDAKKTAVVTVVTTADANDQMGKPNLQVFLRDNPALDTPIECLRIPSKQNPSLGRLGLNFNNQRKEEKVPWCRHKVN